MANKTIKYCSYCGNDTGIEIYSDTYIKSLKKHIAHLEDIVENKIYAKYFTLEDSLKVLQALINEEGKDYVERQINMMKGKR